MCRFRQFLSTLLDLSEFVGVVDLSTTPTSLFLHLKEQPLVTKTSIFALSTQEISPVSETLQLREMEQ